MEAEIHFSGSFSTKTNTWMWAWANRHLNENVKSASRVIQDIGLEQNFMKLAAAHWSAEEVDGWEMTSILAKEINAIGAYRTPDENGFTFMVVTNAKWVNTNRILRLFGKMLNKTISTDIKNCAGRSFLCSFCLRLWQRYAYIGNRTWNK